MNHAKHQTFLKIYKESDQEGLLKSRGCGNLVFPLSARGCKQKLALVNAGNVLRNPNGEVLPFQNDFPLFYQSWIECKDVYPIAFDGLKQWDRIVVDCLTQLTTRFYEGGEKIPLYKTPVQGSIHLHWEEETQPIEREQLIQGEALRKDFPDEQVKAAVCLTKEQRGYLSYCPRLWMIVTGFYMEAQEWKSSTEWVLESLECHPLMEMEKKSRIQDFFI